jgi:hypothetical protein
MLSIMSNKKAGTGLHRRFASQDLPDAPKDSEL